MNTLLNLLPARLIRAAGRLQFRFPVLSKPINFFGQLIARTGFIQRGAGKGLRFNGRGCSPGYVAGTSEPLEQELVVKYARAGAVFYDVGANAGFYAVIAANAIGPSGQVYAFEPVPDLAARIRENAAINSLDNITVIENAVSDKAGTVRFRLDSPLSMLGSIGSALGAADVATVECISLDIFGEVHRPPSLILIDVEGGEIEVLTGGLNLISRYHPVIMVEVHWLGNRFIDFFECNLKPLGYLASTYEGGPLPLDPIRFHALLVPRSGSQA